MKLKSKMSKHRLYMRNSRFSNILDSPQSSKADQVPNERDVESEDLGSDSDSDSDSDFFASSGNNLRLPYTKEEDEFILKFVLKGKNIYKTSTLSLWKHLESKKECPKRTYQSLKNRFLRNIKPNIFTTFGNLVQDDDTCSKIINKFPELRKSFHVKKTTPLLNIKYRSNCNERNQADEPGESLSNVKNSPENNSPVLQKNPLPNESVAQMDESLNLGIDSKNNCSVPVKNLFVCEEAAGKSEGTSSKREKSPLKSQPTPKKNKTSNLEDINEMINEGSWRYAIKATDSGSQSRQAYINQDNGISVTLKNNLAIRKDKFYELGIYEKFMKLKEKNNIKPCPTCGRG